MGELLKLSSGPPGERFALWREVICQTFVRLDPATDAPERFRGRLDVRRCGSLLAADIAATPQRVERSRRGIAQSSGEIYFVNLQLAGRGWHAQGGNECVLRPGEFAVLDATEPFTMAFDAPFHQLSLKVPQDTWRAISGRDRPPLARTAPIDLELSRRYVGLIDRALRDGRAAQAERIVENLVGLTSALVDDEEIAVEPMLDPRLDWLKAWIGQHLTDPSLSPADAAEAIGLSLRSVHSLFEGSGTTFSAYVRDRRLALAGRMLRAPNGRDRIIDIAFATGFGDLSAFGRAFQKAFGMSPSTYRRRHQRPAVH